MKIRSLKSMSKTAIEQKWCKDVAHFAMNSHWMINKFGRHTENPCKFHIHHVEGRKAKRKVNFVSTQIGEFYILPVPIDLHDVNRTDNPLNVTHAKKKFEAVIGTQKELWIDMVNCMSNMGYVVPFDSEVMDVI